MSRKRNGFAIGWLTVALACGGGDQTSEPPLAQQDSHATPPATVLPLPGEPSATSSAGLTAVAGPLAWTAPATWIEEVPSSAMRRAQYRVPGSDGDGECVVYYFGPGQGGDPQSNAARWAGQFTQPDGSSSLEAMRVSRLDGGTLPIQIVEISGTYDGGMTMTDAPAQAHSGYMLLGGIALAADAPWFFKFTGPESTVRAERRAFEAMLESLHAAR